MNRNLLVAAALVSISGLLTSCGGGDSSTPPPAAVAAVTISGVAADGLLQGATAFYDLNDNGALDAGEPTSVTDANGKFSFDVAAAEAGNHRVVVNVPATAVDKDTGAAVGAAFTLLSPATGSSTQSVFASPLTTLVQTHMDSTGVTLSAASDFIKAQAGLVISPLADYTAASNADNKQAGSVARLVVLTTQKQSDAVASLVGQVDISGATITAADLKKAVTEAIIAALPGIASAVADPAVATASGAALQAMLATAADVVVTQTGLTPQTVAAAVGVARLPADTSADAPAPGASLTALRYTSADNWFTRTLESSAADNTADANNKVRYYSVYRESTPSNFSPAGVVHSWGAVNTLSRAGDLHWDGTGWVSCPLGTRSESTKRDAQGRNSYEYCLRQEEGNTKRSALDLAGKSIASVFQDLIRPFPGGANGVNYANWGPSDLGVFGTAAFPAGAKLFYQTNTVIKSAPAYDVQASNAASAYTAAVAAGGDSRTGSPACSQVTGANSANFISPVTTLEDLVARNPGRPCVSNKGTNSDGTSLDPNEWWSNSTTSIGTVTGSQTLPPGTSNYYTANGHIRVSFVAAGNGVTYFHCLQRKVDGSVRNCVAIGTGTYAIQTLGDGRVMSFSAQPALTQRLGYVRAFVERGGKVYFGYMSQPGSTNYVRLNLEATNAVFKPLGLPPIRPVARASDFSAATAAALATAKGAFGDAGATEAFVIRFGDGGRFLLSQAAPPNSATREQTGAELGWLDLDTTTGKYSSLLEVDSDLTAGTSHPDASASLTISATQIVVGDGSVFLRLAGGSTGIVGLWAVGSATDLSVVHLAFFANGKVLLIDSQGDTEGGACALAKQGPPGAEYASYTFNAATGALRVFGKIYDTNGCAGLFDSSAGGTANTEANVTILMAADGTTATVTIPGEPQLTIYRVPSQ